MSQSTHSSFDLVERQQAFVGLLTQPLLTRDLDPQLHRLVTRHRPSLTRWCGHLGYRLVLVGTTFRLRRSPQPVVPVALPASDPPDRQTLVLLLVLAAVLEEIRTDTVDIQTLSDAVRDTVAVQEFTPYDPGRRADRRRLVAAVRRAESHGVLRALTRDELLDRWESGGEGGGAGYAINRHALFLLVDPGDLAAARAAAEAGTDQLFASAGSPTELPDAGEGDRSELASPEAAGPTARTSDPHSPDPRAQRLLRTLLETQGLEFARLSVEDLDYWRRQRARLIARAVEFTGGTVDVTADYATLILTTDHRAGREATESFPSAKAAHWVSLKLLDAAARTGTHQGDGSLDWSSEQVDRVSAEISAELGDRLAAELRGNPSAIRRAAEKTLIDAGLLTAATDWRLSPLAARYRSATLRVGVRATALLEEDE